jgi:hypothetical protein
MCRQFDSGPRHHQFWLSGAKCKVPAPLYRNLLLSADTNADTNGARHAGTSSARTGNADA